MPIVRNRDKKGAFYKANDEKGKPYYYTVKDKESRSAAKTRAEKQAQRIEARNSAPQSD